MEDNMRKIIYIVGSRENAGTWGRDLAWWQKNKKQKTKKNQNKQTKKNRRQVPNQGRELTWMVQAKGGLLVRIKTCQNSTSWGQASGYTALILMFMGKNWGFPGKAISMFVLENMDCFSSDLVFPAALFIIQFFLSLSWLFTYYSYFPFLFSCGDLWFNKITTII